MSQTLILLEYKSAVEATFLKTARQLERKPEWKAAQTAQVHEMVDRRAAIELTEEIRRSWTGPVWYVTRQFELCDSSRTDQSKQTEWKPTNFTGRG